MLVMASDDSIGTEHGDVTVPSLGDRKIEPSLERNGICKRNEFPTHRHGTDVGLLLGFAAQAAREHGLHGGAFEVSRCLD